MSLEHIRPLETIEKRQPDILLINVPSSFQQGIIPDDDEPPFGLLRIASTTEQQGHTPAILDAHRAKLNPHEIDDVLYELKPMSVGINPTSVNVPEAQEIAEVCARHDIPLIIGGVHATLDTFNALKKDFPMALAVVKGKGEIPTIQILTDIKKGQQREINGVYYQDAKTNRDDFADYYPLDKQPLINQGRWVENPLIKRVIEINGESIELNEISLYETAGCPFECTFCATPALTGRYRGYRPYYRPTMGRILASTRLAIDLGANAVHFIDDLAFSRPQDFNDFVTGIERLKLPGQFYWRAMTRASIIAKCSDDILTALAQSGCWRIAMGVESGDEQILQRVKKRITKEQVRNAVTRLRQAGIPQVKAFFIMGFPDETIEQMEATSRFIIELKQLGLTDISLFQFKPYPGTAEWQYLEKVNPEVLKALSYSRQNFDQGNISAKKLNEAVWLPDDLQIAAVPSKIVREMVEATILEFYET